MASLNKAQIIGNLTRDPELRTFPSGDQVCNITVATSEKYKDKTSGEMKEVTEFHRIAFFGKLAEIGAKYLVKGSQVYVEGSIKTRKYSDKDGVEKYATEIKAERLQMLGSKPSGESRPATAPVQQSRPATSSGGATGFDDFDDGIPPF